MDGKCKFMQRLMVVVSALCLSYSRVQPTCLPRAEPFFVARWLTEEFSDVSLDARWELSLCVKRACAWRLRLLLLANTRILAWRRMP